MTRSDLFITKKFVIISTNPVTVEINPDSVIIYRQDVKTIEEEPDTMIVQQVASYVRALKALVVADDTFALCCFFIFVAKTLGSTSVLLVSLIHGCTVLGINATVNQHCDIIPIVVWCSWNTGFVVCSVVSSVV